MDTQLDALQAQEAALVGKWVYSAGSTVADHTCRRIETLTARVLERVAEHPEEGGWTTLFRDPRDGRFWERTYPQGELHGGGPPALHNLSDADAKARYKL